MCSLGDALEEIGFEGPLPQPLKENAAQPLCLSSL